MKYLYKIFFIVFLTTVYGNDKSNENILSARLSSRIVGGTKAPDGAFPYQVSIQINNKHKCGGAIISDRWILTSGDCVAFVDNEEAVVFVGSNKLNANGVSYQSVQVIPHEKFNRWSTENNIGLIKVNETIKFNDFISAIPISSSVTLNQMAVISGWSSSSESGEISNDLMYAELHLLSDVGCAYNYRSLSFFADQVCTSRNRKISITCKGGSGNPAVIDGKLVAIEFRYNDECGSTENPDVFIRVDSHEYWINSVINKF